MTALAALWFALVYYDHFLGVALTTTVAAVLAVVYFHFDLEETTENQRQFRRFVRFLFRRPLSDWVIAAALSLCAGFAVLFVSHLVNKGVWNLEAPEATGTMLSVFVATIATSILYRRHAPIDDWHELLGLIVDDLSRVLTHGGTVWITFPALSIGGHRSIDSLGNIDLSSRFWTMKDQLRDCVESGNVDSYFVVFDDVLAEKLFEEHSEAVGGSAEQLAKWKDIERIMREERRRRPARDPSNCLVYVDPAVMTNFFIVIGDATYSIQVHGFPYYMGDGRDKFDKSQWFGRFIEASSDPRLLAYRREEPSLAEGTRWQLKQKMDFLRGRPDLARFDGTCTLEQP